MRTVLVMLCGIMLPALAFAQAWDMRETRTRPLPFLEGVLAGIVAHEIGHGLVATAKGYDLGVRGLSIVYPDAAMSRSDHLELASAGIQAQWLLSEAILRGYEAHPAEALSQYRAGMVMSHIAITAAYLTFLKDHPDGDLVGMAEATGLSTDTLAAAVLLPAVLDYWRLTGKDVPRWVPAVSAGYKGAGLAVIWAY
ncbi:MAG TPA: hypothetical protein PLZ36_06295 [Armatimonadota bacterium]|nr:hypothetical protein [Armatimonadota bacterium]